MAQICTKSFVGWGTGGAYSAPPDPIAGLGVGPPGEGEEGREGKGGEGDVRLGPLHPGREGRGREWREGWGRR